MGARRASFEGLDESVLIMEVMDEVRRQHDFQYPKQIETLDRVQL